MFQTTIKRGFIYHAMSKKRREVLIDDALRSATIQTIENVRKLLQTQKIPAANYLPRCHGCSLFGTCLPKLSDADERAVLLDITT